VPLKPIVYLILWRHTHRASKKNYTNGLVHPLPNS